MHSHEDYFIITLFDRKTSSTGIINRVLVDFTLHETKTKARPVESAAPR